MRVDSHQHFWRYVPSRDTWITDAMSALKRDFLPADLAPLLKAQGIGGCIAVQADQSEHETEFLLGLAEESNFIQGVVGWIDLRAPNLRSRLEHFSRFKKLRGFRHIVQAEQDDRFLLREDFTAGVGTLEEFGFTYDILIYPWQLPAAVEFVARLPGQRFVVDHLAKPKIRAGAIEPWAQHMRAMGEYKNVYCKLSGMVTEADWKNWKLSDFVPYLDVVFEVFGADRLIFGSDWPVCLLAGTYERVVGLMAGYLDRLPVADRERIWGTNAAEFYGLDATSREAAQE